MKEPQDKVTLKSRLKMLKYILQWEVSMRERVVNFATNIGGAAGEIYLGYMMMGIFPLGTLAGVLLIERGARTFERTLHI